MKVEDTSSRKIYIKLSPSEIRNLIAAEIERHVDIKVKPENIYFNIETDRYDDFRYSLEYASYRCEEPVKCDIL